MTKQMLGSTWISIERLVKLACKNALLFGWEVSPIG